MLRLAAFISLQLIACSGLQWSDRLQSDDQGPAEITLCSGDNIQLFWNYTLDDGERVTGTEWTCQPAGKTTPELLATYVEGTNGGNFVPTSPFSGRVLRLTGGGLEVSCATISESGTYRIAVTTVNDVTGVTSVHRNTARVKVVDPPKTRSGQLEVRQSREATLDPATGHWHVQLTCGNFSDRGHPTVDVLWKTPAGNILRSSSFDNSTGDFQLLVPNPVRGGRYACSLEKPDAAENAFGEKSRSEVKAAAAAPATHCLQPDSPLLGDAAVRVDETSARFSLLEARQGELEELLEAQDRRFEDYVTNVTEALMKVPDERRVVFHAELEADPYLPTMNFNYDIRPSLVKLNEGGGYDPGTGRFTAHANGSYFFTATSAPGSSSVRYNNNPVNMEIVKVGDTEPAAGVLMKADMSGTCNVIMYLSAGEQVYLRGKPNTGQLSFARGRTTFSGFRL